jgi:hypothetical protein
MEHVNGIEVKTAIERMQTSLKLSTVRNVIDGALSGRVQPPKSAWTLSRLHRFVEPARELLIITLID